MLKLYAFSIYQETSTVLPTYIVISKYFKIVPITTAEMICVQRGWTEELWQMYQVYCMLQIHEKGTGD